MSSGASSSSSESSESDSAGAARAPSAAPARNARPPLFTPRFFLMCGFNSVVFLSAFQLLPTAPFRILDIGGSTVVAGLFLGFLTYASAFSAPFTGAIADRIGRRRTLVICSTAIFLMSFAYGLTTTWPPMLAIVLVHGVFWSGLLTAAGAYVTDLMPPSRRAEGLGYYGLSSIFAVAVAPALGLWVYQHGWLWLCVSIGVLNLTMAIIATQLEESPRNIAAMGKPLLSHEVLEWRVAIVSLTLFLLSFGYGGITSFVAIYAKENGVSPSSLYFSVTACAMVLTRPFSGTLADRIGPVKVLAPCLLLATLGYALLAFGGSKTMLITSAIVFGAGFGSAYPAFAAFVMRHVEDTKRAAAFGGILAALDTGIGSGSITLGWIIQRHGFPTAYATAACVAALALPWFLFTRRRVLGHRVIETV
jgi:MFS family permease